MTSRPPRTGPSAGASVVDTVRIAEALMRSSGGNTRNSMAAQASPSLLRRPAERLLAAPCPTRKTGGEQLTWLDGGPVPSHI